MTKLVIALLLLVFMFSGCSMLAKEDQCYLVEMTTQTYVMSTTGDLEHKGDIKEIVEGINASINLATESIDDSTTLDVIHIIQCAVDGVMEGLE